MPLETLTHIAAWYIVDILLFFSISRDAASAYSLAHILLELHW
jgi:hypothetical protein